MCARVSGPRITVTLLLGLALVAALVPATPPRVLASAAPPNDGGSPRYAGWAMIAYPSMSEADLRAAIWRQLAAGANVVWVGHNNPGEVDASTAEPAISYAVYEAYVDPDDPRHADAAAIVAAQLRLLRVARELGTRVVFPVGYQLRMGNTWDAANPDHLRRNARGGVALDLGVPNASYYSPVFRQDLRRYYEWAYRELVRPYRDILWMVNLADEPGGADYSEWADRAFAGRTGYSFAEVGDDPQRQLELGRFQANQIVEYAAWAATQWAELDPSLPTTMSFCGATARLHLQLPHVEHLFAHTPRTFYPTFDAYPRDGPPEAAIDDASLVELFSLVRSLGHYSARYQRPFWLWSTANSWGLAQASPKPANVADAVANAYYLALLARQMGGHLQGIAVWNYNAYGQGLYNDVHVTTYDPEVMFARVSETLPHVRRILSAPAGSARVLVYAPDTFAYRRLGVEPTIDSWRFRSYRLDRLLALARNNVAAAVVPDLEGEELASVRGIVVLARSPEDISPADLGRLRDAAARGLPVVASQTLEGALGANVLYVSQIAEQAFSDSPSASDREIWQRVLGVSDPVQGYYVASGDMALLYSIRDERTALRVQLPFAASGYRSDRSGAPTESISAGSGPLRVELERGQYAYLDRRDPEPPAARTR